MINLFGGSGFVGSYVFKNIPSIINDRNDLTVSLYGDIKDVLYLISTVDNYNVTANPFIDIETNLTTLIRVLENFRKIDLEKKVFNFASSWFVYGNTELPAKETSYCDPKGFYSITKRAAEQLLISYCETYNLNYRILRFANVIGMGDQKVSKKKNALTYLLNELKNNKEVELYGGGDFYRDYIHVEDLVRAIKLILEKGDINTIYNVGNGEAILFKEIIDYAKKTMGSSSILTNIEPKNFHKVTQVKSMYMDNTRLKNLGYEPTRSVFDFVDEFVKA